jgi:hypothetical protein
VLKKKKQIGFNHTQEGIFPIPDDDFPIHCLRVPSLLQASAHAAAASLEDGDDAVPIPYIPPRSGFV